MGGERGKEANAFAPKTTDYRLRNLKHILSLTSAVKLHVLSS